MVFMCRLAGRNLCVFLFASRNILSKSRELGAKTLAICVVSTVQKNFPPDIGAHIALRKGFCHFITIAFNLIHI